MKIFGLADRDMLMIKHIFQKYPVVRDVRIFGSRSKRTEYAGSDIDLAIMNSGIEFNDLLRLRSDFDDSGLAYAVDVVYYPALKHQELKEHIDRAGVIFYQA